MRVFLFVYFGFFLSIFSVQGQLPQHFKYTRDMNKEGINPERLARVDSFLQLWIKNGNIPHAVTFVAKNGSIMHHKAYGWKNKEKGELLKNDDIFRIASQSKAIISVGLMMLYEKGKFLLDDPVSLYIPAFKNMLVLDSVNMKDSSFIAHPAKKEITIRQLLNHTAGFTYENPYYLKNKIPFYNSVYDLTIEDMVNRLIKLPLKHEPGAAYTYGLSTDVCGYLIEVLSGMKLDEYLRINIFEPLGMKDTYFYLPDNKAARLVTVYEKPNKNAELKLTRFTQNQVFPISGAKKYFSGGAGLCGTIEDYAKFCQMLLNGGKFNGNQIISRKTVDLMTTNQIGDLVINKEGDKFGLGFQLFTERGANARFLSSKGAFRWGSMYCTDYVVDPKEGIVCLLYTNVHPFAQHGELLEKYRILVYQSLK